jgi:hypothetical protein
MAPRKYDDRMKLDMPFDEALERFAGTDPAETQANVEKAKKAKPPGGKQAKQPPDDNVASLRQRRMTKRNTGR